MKDVSIDIFGQTRSKLASLRPAKLTDIATSLGYSESDTGMLSDVLHGRHGHVSDARLNDLRRRLGLSYNVTIPAIPCPSCGKLHQLADCHGAHVQMVRRSPPCRIQDMPVKELAWRIEHREEIVL